MATSPPEAVKKKRTLRAMAVSTVVNTNKYCHCRTHTHWGFVDVCSQPFPAFVFGFKLFLPAFLFVFVTDMNPFGRGAHGAYEQYI